MKLLKEMNIKSQQTLQENRDIEHIKQTRTEFCYTWAAMLHYKTFFFCNKLALDV